VPRGDETRGSTSAVAAFGSFRYVDRAVFVTEGRDQATIQAFSGFLAAHGGQAANVEEVCEDMSEAFLTGTLKHLPEAEITFVASLPAS
jgi:transposase